MISIREISDDNTTISSTRWAFATVIKFDIVVILLVIAAGLVAHFIPCVDEIESGFYGNVTMLLGVLTGVAGAAKALQGFETKADDKGQKTEMIITG